MAIKSSVSNNFLSMFFDGINVFDCLLPGVIILQETLLKIKRTVKWLISKYHFEVKEHTNCIVLQFLPPSMTLTLDWPLKPLLFMLSFVALCPSQQLWSYQDGQFT